MSKKAPKCPKCKDKMDMYYSPYCPRCFDNTPKNIKCLNLIQTLMHLQVITQDKEFKTTMWAHFVDNNDICSNDTYFSYHIETEAEQVLYNFKEQSILNNYLVSLGLERGSLILFEVSW